MPRPQSKDELIFLSQKNFDRLMDEVNAYPEEKEGKPFHLLL